MEETEKQDLLVVGLGNPGKKYEMTRHNIGYITVQALAQALGIAFKEEKRFKAHFAKGASNGATVHLLLPATYMNLCGEAVRKYADFYKLAPGRIIVVVDDADLPFGKLRLREKGGTGGHNGLKSIQEHLGTQNYPRLRMGIGRNANAQSLVGHVLNKFNKEEMALLPEFVSAGIDCLKRIPHDDFETLMKSVNTSQEDANHRPS